MFKINFIFDKTKKSLNFKKQVLKTHINYSAQKADCFVVAGGDGFMLQSIKKNYKYNKPFYGINCGTYGFLMNRYHVKNLNFKIKKSKKIIINPIKVQAIDYKKKKLKLIAINEVSLFRQSRQTSSIQVMENNKMIIKKLIGDGILVSTPAGSTAYNFSVNGPILTLMSGKLAVTPISPFRPRRWKGRLTSNTQEVVITNLDPIKRPVAAVADNIEIRNVKSVNISISKKIIFYLMYEKSRSLIKRIKLEQIRQKI